LIIKESIL